MNTRILTIIFSTLAAMFTELNALILSGCEVDHKPDTPPEFQTTPGGEPGTVNVSGGGVQEAAAILSGAPELQGPAALQPETAAPPGGTVAAPPAPVAGVTVTGNTPPAVDPNVQVDVEGLPWDKRIHSSGKTFYKSKAANGAPKGAWKLKKGVDAVTVAQIKTELAGGAPAGTAAPAVIPATTPATTAPGETTEVCTDIYTWASLVEKATAAGITPEVMAAACQKFNVPGIIELQDQALLIPVVGKELGL